MAASSMQQELDNLVPRRYQEEVFLRACKDNIIAALNTGSGKTFISLLLIKWMAAQEESKGKVIIFLVPRVALVQQQGDYIVKNTSLRVIKLFGALDLDLSDRKAWRQRFSEHDVFVMTAQIFLNVLTHSLWSIDRVCLMIFDECHHTRKNHPYNGILRECFQVKPPSRRPKIFGMTASPIWDPKNASNSLEVLEANMGCKIVGVMENHEELQEHSPKPVEIVKTYAPPSESFDFPLPSIYSCLKVFEHVLLNITDFSWPNVEGRYHVTWYNLGPYSASLFLYTELLHAATRLNHDNFGVPNVSHITESSNSLSKHNPSEVAIIHDILQGFRHLFPHGSKMDIPLSIPLPWCTPKVKLLVDVLLSHHTPIFQGIVFVEQRQVAACLASLLPAIPELKGKVRCGHFVGEGVNSGGISSSMGANVSDTVQAFRNGTINILIATSVAEEGLDFPACDLVVRFDPLQHMVGYVQSRGRARSRTSTFVVMVQENDCAQLARYNALKEGEPEISRVYRCRKDDMDDEDESDDDEVTAADLDQRERYVVPETGAILNYDNAIGLLNHLCSSIPTDIYTPTHKPVFSGDFKVTLHLPSSLPLSREHRTYDGPFRQTKKEAKRAAAFLAARQLREMNVLDEYLLPMSSTAGDVDAEGYEQLKDHVPEVMDASVRNPWVMGARLWIHEIVFHGRRIAGVVTGTRLVDDRLRYLSNYVEIRAGQPVTFHEEDELLQRQAMARFTKLGIYYRLTGSPIEGIPSVFLVPLTLGGQPDFQAIDRLLENPRGSSDWVTFNEDHRTELLVTVNSYVGRIYRLRRIRHDLTPMSPPSPGSREVNFESYRDYFLDRWKRKRYIPSIPTEGPMVELELLPRVLNGLYDLKCSNTIPVVTATAPDGGTFPQQCCRWLDLGTDVYKAFNLLPAICHRLTDTFRSNCLRSQLGLPLVDRDLLVEALTLPSAHAGYNNQRLETLGDAVLQLCTTVHLFNRYPHRHEGQLTTMRQSIVSNKSLSARAKLLGLEQFLTNEAVRVGRWTYTLTEDEDGLLDHPRRYARRSIPRRSLQDCMEALLGASFLSGGIARAVYMGQALGLAFGQADPWSAHCPSRSRTERSASPSISPYFLRLEEKLGYGFCENKLLLEAMTHPSFSVDSGGHSYQRLEFLGDAILSLVVVEYLYEKHPRATSYQLSMPRSKVVCAAALAWIAVKHLELHKLLLANSVELNIAINRYVPILEAASAEDIVERGWRYDPPKALSDVFESVMGAVFIDSGYNYDKTAAVIRVAMEAVLVVLSPAVCRDPISKLMEWTAGQGCRRLAVREIPKKQGDQTVRGMGVVVHDIVMVGPIVARSLRVARFEAASVAMDILTDGEGRRLFERLCRCKTEVVEDVEMEDATSAAEEEERRNNIWTSETPIGLSATIMSVLANTAFLDHLKSLFPDKTGSNPWFIVAAVAFSASNRPEEVPRVFAHAIKDVQTEQEKLTVARKFRDALFKAGLICGYSRTINGLRALDDAMPEQLRDASVLRNVDISLEEYGKLGRRMFEYQYGDTAPRVQSLLNGIYPDMGWFTSTIAYGIVYGFTEILSPLETTYTLVASLISVDTAQQIIWHLANARRTGATLEEVQAVRQIAIEVASSAGVHWRHGVPEVQDDDD
ncbi:hypothetical protein AX17_001888 [Amanita inopinata Kibby_2008]|nr:hypothetical protein AX17_001888 [Amanita inopinata Kibby_2008]